MLEFDKNFRIKYYGVKNTFFEILKNFSCFLLLNEEVYQMGKVVEIRWHGRGGQGAKTASLLLADAAFNTGKFIQGFPEYGPERMGAPITAYNRISDEKLTIHSNIYEPDYVVVVDDTLITAVDVTSGLKEDGAIIINTTKSPEELKPLLKGYKGKVCTIDARTISIETLGKYFPNTPMLGAVVKVSKVMNEQEFLKDMVDSFKHKFAKKPEVVEGNIKALERSMQEVKGI
ncbi:MAG: Pyruvate synthase subunit PorC [Firmicutes bacterium ADurb.Bin419]|nr:MAG: Pyruvate synthase subunit PorC [Firmicutes bacterium ADurb.Bin419]